MVAYIAYLNVTFFRHMTIKILEKVLLGAALNKSNEVTGSYYLLY